MGLKDAWEKAEAARKADGAGLDPIAERERAAAALVAGREATETAKAPTFNAVAESCIKAQAPDWKSGRTADLWRTSLENYAHATLGKLPVGAVDREVVLAAVDRVWRTRPATGRKVLRRIGTVLRYAPRQGLARQ